MKIEDYLAVYPNSEISYLFNDRKHKIEQGALEFEEESASIWAPPFNNKWAYYALIDGLKFCHKLSTESELRHKIANSYYIFPRRFFLTNKSVMNEHRVSELLAQMTEKEITYYNKCVELNVKEHYTVEKPYGLYMCGNDDTSYTKFYPSLNDATEELRMFEACQPLNFYADLHDFVFTN